MKRNLRILLIAGLLITSPLFILAQTPPHPNGGANPGASNGPVGGGAPIGGGLTILIVLGAAYGARKLYQLSSATAIIE